MSTGVLCALRGEVEAAAVRTVTGTPGLEVTRRCADLTELLASADAGLGRVALVDGALPGLDRQVVRHLHEAGVWVVTLVGVARPTTARWTVDPDGLGADLVLAEDDVPAAVQALVRLLRDADRTGARPGLPGPDLVITRGVVDAPGPSGPAAPVALDAVLGPVGFGAPAGSTPEPSRGGRLVAVWGPTGAPGRTTVAIGLAAELAVVPAVVGAGPGRGVLLVDADTYGGTVAPVLGLLDEAPGLAAAARAALAGRLDLPTLAALTPALDDGVRVLTGISRAARWPEVPAAGLEVVWEVARGLAAWTVVDCGFCLEEDEVLSYDTRAPSRNGATLSAIEHADTVVVVGAGDPIGLQRLVRGLGDLADRQGAPPARVVVVNRVRSSAGGPRPADAVRDALRRYAGVEDVHVVPEDPAVDGALLAGRTLVEHAPTSAARRAMTGLARAVLATAVPAGAH